MIASNVAKSLEKDLEYLETEIIRLENANSILSQENRQLEQELNRYCEDFNSDEEVIERIHILYYDICSKVDNGQPIELELLNAFFLKAIDKAV